MDRIRIRVASESDALTLARLRYEFRSLFHQVREDEATFVERCTVWMRERLRSESLWKCWIAESQDTAVGDVWVQLVEKIPNPIEEPEYYIYLTNFYVREQHRRPESRGCVGAVIQSYMRRSEADVADLLHDGIRIRLCKGAYKEPPEIAYQAKAEVDANYLRLMKTLLKSGGYHGLATHDENIIREVQAFVIREKIPRDAFEFQMLYGIRRNLQQALTREGWRLRVYVPFGTEWYPYLMRRLAERPANLGFVLKNMLRG